MSVQIIAILGHPSISRQRSDRTQLQQIVAGLPEGIVVIELDQTIA